MEQLPQPPNPFVDPALAPHYIAPEDLSEKIQTHQLAFAQNVIENSVPLLEGRSPHGVILRPHQPEIVEDYVHFFQETATQIGRKALLPLPPNSGKSTFAAIMSDLAGIGQQVAPHFSAPRALILVPRKVAAAQMLDAYKTFAPHLRTIIYDRRRRLQNFDADVLIRSYQGCLDAPEKERQYMGEWADLLLPDEVHRGLGPETSKFLKWTMSEYNPTMLALSATPDYDEVRSTKKIFDIAHTLRSITPREAIHRNISNGAQIFALYSGEEVCFRSKRDSITEEDVKSLINSVPRNDLLLDIIKNEALDRRQGLVQCLSGNESEHAIKIARAARKIKIIDPVTQKQRRLRVRAVGNFQSDKENQRVLDAFKAGELDALTFTRYLTEAFDSSRVRYLVPTITASQVDMHQFFGRGGRLGPDKRPTRIWYIVDRYISKKRKHIKTPFDVVGEKMIIQGLLIEAQSSERKAAKAKSSTPTRRKRGFTYEPAAEPLHMSPKMLEAMKALPSGTLLQELMVVGQELEEVPDDYIPLRDLPVVKNGLVSAEGAQYVLNGKYTDDGRPFSVRISGAQGMQKRYVLKDAQDYLHNRYVKGEHTIERLQMNTFLRSFGWPDLSHDVFLKTCEKLEIEFTFVKSQNQAGKTINLKPEEALQILRDIVAVPFIDPASQISVADIARATGESTSSTISRFLKADVNTFGQYRTRVRCGNLVRPYRVVEVLPLELAPAFLTEYAKVNKRMRWAIEASSIEQVIADARVATLQAFWTRKMQRVIPDEAIQAFVGLDITPPENERIIMQEIKAALSKLGQDYIVDDSDPHWRNHAACATEDPEAFFEPLTDAGRLAAKAICARCKVKGNCLKLALENEHVEAIMGGMTFKERKRFAATYGVRWLDLIQLPKETDD